MKPLYIALTTIALLVLMLSCTSPWREQQLLREAEMGLNAAIAQLPKPSAFDVAAVISETAVVEDYYVARASVVLGTSLSEEEALSLYVDELQALGWRLQERKQYEDTKFLDHPDKHEQIVVEYGLIGWLIETREEYIQAKKSYPSIIIVGVDYILTSREE